jgi:guanylate kinase
VGILVLPPSRQTLEKRLRNRSISEGSVSDEVIERRLTAARKEIENFPKYDYILVNDRLEDSVELLESIVLSERVKRSGKVLTPDEVRMIQRAEQCLQTANTTSNKLKEVLASFAPASSG